MISYILMGVLQWQESEVRIISRWYAKRKRLHRGRRWDEEDNEDYENEDEESEDCSDDDFFEEQEKE